MMHAALPACRIAYGNKLQDEVKRIRNQQNTLDILSVPFTFDIKFFVALFSCLAFDHSIIPMPAN